MYCPSCLNESLVLKKRGKAYVEVNGKKMDARMFLYNQDKEKPEVIKESLLKKMDEYFKWFATFKNPVAIKSIEVYSHDFVCSNKCALDLKNHLTVIGNLISTDELKKMAKELASKYGLLLEWEKKK